MFVCQCLTAARPGELFRLQQVNTHTQTHTVVGQEQAVLCDPTRAEPWFILRVTSGLGNIRQTALDALFWPFAPVSAALFPSHPPTPEQDGFPPGRPGVYGGTLGKSVLLTRWWRCDRTWAESAGSSGQRSWLPPFARECLLGNSAHTACVISINRFSGRTRSSSRPRRRTTGRPGPRLSPQSHEEDERRK